MEDRRMIFPYTLSARITRFPFKFYYENHTYFRGYVWALFLSLPIFYKIQKASFAEGNYKRYELYLKKEEEEYERHKEHLL